MVRHYRMVLLICNQRTHKKIVSESKSSLEYNNVIRLHKKYKKHKKNIKTTVSSKVLHFQMVKDNK